jgi:hypothetical protein
MAHNLPFGRRRDSRLRATAELSRELRLDANDRQLSRFSLVSPPSCRMVLVGKRLVVGRRTIACCDLKCGNCRSCLRGRSWSPARDCEMRSTAESGTGRRIKTDCSAKSVRSECASRVQCSIRRRSWANCFSTSYWGSLESLRMSHTAPQQRGHQGPRVRLVSGDGAFTDYLKQSG